MSKFVVLVQVIVVCTSLPCGGAVPVKHGRIITTAKGLVVTADGE